ncbi:MAG: hypothetical protein CL947_00925 [Epsilonproteobacteria bacterium]|nr:hypothetical protein [Campylobacterota bacterium]
MKKIIYSFLLCANIVCASDLETLSTRSYIKNYQNYVPLLHAIPSAELNYQNLSLRMQDETDYQFINRIQQYQQDVLPTDQRSYLDPESLPDFDKKMSDEEYASFVQDYQIFEGKDTLEGYVISADLDVELKAKSAQQRTKELFERKRSHNIKPSQERDLLVYKEQKRIALESRQQRDRIIHKHCKGARQQQQYQVVDAQNRFALSEFDNFDSDSNNDNNYYQVQQNQVHENHGNRNYISVFSESKTDSQRDCFAEQISQLPANRDNASCPSLSTKKGKKLRFKVQKQLNKQSDTRPLPCAAFDEDNISECNKNQCFANTNQADNVTNTNRDSKKAQSYKTLGSDSFARLVLKNQKVTYIPNAHHQQTDQFDRDPNAAYAGSQNQDSSRKNSVSSNRNNDQQQQSAQVNNTAQRPDISLMITIFSGRNSASSQASGRYNNASSGEAQESSWSKSGDDGGEKPTHSSELLRFTSSNRVDSHILRHQERTEQLKSQLLSQINVVSDDLSLMQCANDVKMQARVAVVKQNKEQLYSEIISSQSVAELDDLKDKIAGLKDQLQKLQTFITEQNSSCRCCS